jgi:CubicO group peptidase (beta-lactamase class C family)
VHLLEHTTGWDDLGLRDYAFNPEQKASLREGLDLRPISRRSRWRPGTRFFYCNSGPAAAAYIVEQITRERFEDYIERNWFRPLGMKSASYHGAPEVLGRLTKLYQGDGTTRYPYWKISLRPAGAINVRSRCPSSRSPGWWRRSVTGERAFGASSGGTPSPRRCCLRLRRRISPSGALSG